MPHTCKAPNCDRPIFGGGYCKYDQYRRRMQGGDKYMPNKPKYTPLQPRSPESNTSIPRRTKKRLNDEKYYAIQAKEFFYDAVNNKTNICVFCGEKVTRFEGLHHWKGRVGKYLLDKQWWSIVDNDCHLFFHRATFTQLKQRFGDSFFERLQKFNYSLWEKLMNRENKSVKLNPSLFSEKADENSL